ncbi:TM2 domain [Thiomonas bhubaneswarensis]|uniref:TM2 domain n=2 Tax=Thiomonas bhubaneswarensis TaxID=339866 RepID=A0A0K6I1S4_9BURK|nr:TM2 domain [Thiomonas bhubaneswarensis]
MMTAQTAFKSKFLAALLALVTGVVGGHRFYLHGWKDRWAWLHGPLFIVGLLGVWRFVPQHRDDALTWVLLGVFVAVVIAVVVQTLVIGLTSDERWDARWNQGSARRSANGWGPVLIVIFALFMSVGSLTGGLAYVLQRFFGGA